MSTLIGFSLCRAQMILENPSAFSQEERHFYIMHYVVVDFLLKFSFTFAETFGNLLLLYAKYQVGLKQL